MKTRIMSKLAVVCVLFCSVSYADDVYLKTGFVLRNVQVIDTIDGLVNIYRDGRRTTIHVEDILKIEQREMRPREKSSYEMFSLDLYNEFLKSQPEREQLERERRKQLMASRMAARTDSLQRMEERLDSTYSWRRSVYLAGGWGIPQGARFELGYNFGGNVALALSFGIGDNWSRDPDEGTLAILGSLRFPLQSTRITPYLLICIGGTITVPGTLRFFIDAPSDTYLLFYAGAIVSVKPGLQLRPEFGIAFTTKPTEDNTRFGAHLAIEIDFRQLF